MKTQKNLSKVLSLLVLILTINVAIAQPPPPPPANHRPPREEKQNERKENIEAQKVAFITKKIDLTPEEAQQFWPVFNQYQGKLQELRKKRRQDIKEAKENFEAMTDKDVEQLVDDEIVFRQKELDIQKEFHSKFKTLLPIKKVAKLYQAEEQFKRYLLNELKDRKPPIKE